MFYVAVLVATIASFAFGAAWYMTLSKPWLDAIGFSPEKRAALERGERNPAPFVVAFVSELVMAYVLARVLIRYTGGAVTISSGVLVGMVIAIGFVVTTMAVNNAYSERKPALTLIDSGHWLGVLIVQGFVLGLFGVK